MQHEHRRTIHNPIVGDTLTFIELSKESGGKRTVVEVRLKPGGKSALHYHTSIAETFEALDGLLQLQLGKEQVFIPAGESITIPAGMTHAYANPSSQEIAFRVVITPGFRGFEQFLQIIYGLATGGQTNKEGMPKKLTHIGVLLAMSDTNLPGAIRVIEPLIKLAGHYATWTGVDRQLVEKYCLL